MGKPVIRVGVDKSKGHGCFPPTQPTSASSNVKANGIRVVRMGDKYSPHRCGKVVHGSRVAQSPSTVKVNGRPVHRTGDQISCGDSAGKGSKNVRAG
jgi:uncharacterized Zn-binding protein involved in type VI secretion